MRHAPKVKGPNKAARIAAARQSAMEREMGRVDGFNYEVQNRHYELIKVEGGAAKPKKAQPRLYQIVLLALQ